VNFGLARPPDKTLRPTSHAPLQYEFKTVSLSRPFFTAVENERRKSDEDFRSVWRWARALFIVFMNCPGSRRDAYQSARLTTFERLARDTL
jgi:hypothetical protein